MSEDPEIWKPIPGFEGVYEVSNHGRCRGLNRFTGWRNIKGKVLAPLPDRCGYHRIRISTREKKVGLTIHRLVARAFIPNPLNLPQVNHKDGVKTHNHHSNLEWTDNSGNQRHAIDTGLRVIKFGEEATCFKSRILVYNEDGLHVDTLVGNADMKAKGYDWRNVNACIYGTRKTHRGMTFAREETTKEAA